MPSILIVEDDLTYSLMLTTWLGKKGFQPHAVSSVADAKLWLAKSPTDLILSDLRLPDEDGMNLLAERARPRYSPPHDDRLRGNPDGRPSDEMGCFRLYLQAGQSRGLVAQDKGFA